MIPGFLIVRFGTPDWKNGEWFLGDEGPTPATEDHTFFASVIVLRKIEEADRNRFMKIAADLFPTKVVTR